MIETIRRTEFTVLLEINTGLCIKEPIIYFNHNAGSEVSAELLRQHLYDLRFKAKKAIARDCLMYLNNEEVSALKAKLTKWNGHKHCWKETLK